MVGETRSGGMGRGKLGVGSGSSVPQALKACPLTRYVTPAKIATPPRTGTTPGLNPISLGSHGSERLGE